VTLLSWDPDDTGEPFSALPRRANDLYGWLLEQYEPVTTAEIADAFGWHRQTVRRHLRRLRPIGLAQRVGATLHGEALWVAGVPYRGGGWVYCTGRSAMTIMGGCCARRATRRRDDTK